MISGCRPRELLSANASSCPWTAGGRSRRRPCAASLDGSCRGALRGSSRPSGRTAASSRSQAARVVRPLGEQLNERLRCEHLAPHRRHEQATSSGGRAHRSSRRPRALPQRHRAADLGRARRCRRSTISALRHRLRAARASSPRARARGRRRPDGRSHRRRAIGEPFRNGVEPLGPEAVVAEGLVLTPQSVSSSTASTASRRLPTRRRASPARLRHAIERLLRQRPVHLEPEFVRRAFCEPRRRRSRQRPRNANPPLRPLAPEAISCASRSLTREASSGERERAGASR